MKIYLPEKARDGSTGGGWTFTRNFIKAVQGKAEVVSTLEECDIYFIPGSTLTTKEEVERAKALGKRIVLRIDNAVRDSRNRGAGMSRMKKYAGMADKIIFQSQWAREYLSDFLGKSGPVILNGCDTDIFTEEGDKLPKENYVYLYSRYNRDETKCWHEVYYEFQKLYRENQSRELWIVGQFSPELLEYNFDFFNGEKVKYLGVIKDPMEMAKIYRTVDELMYSYYNDACSNTLIEARACGLKIHLTPSGYTGGSPEIIQRIASNSLEAMGNKYLKVFSEVYCEE